MKLIIQLIMMTRHHNYSLSNALGPFFLFLLLLIPSLSKADQKEFNLVFDRVPVKDLVTLFYDQCETSSLVFDPSIDKLTEVLTLKTNTLGCQKLRQILADALDRAGVAIEKKNGYHVIVTKREDDKAGWQNYIYAPKYQEPVLLADQLLVFIRQGSFAHQKRNNNAISSGASQVSNPTVPANGSNGATITGNRVTQLLFYGPVQEVELLKDILPKLDVPGKQVEISAALYEYQTDKQDTSGVNAALSLFAKLGLTIASPVAAGSSVLKISLSNLDIALSSLDNDSRFRFISKPRVLVQDGQSADFSSTTNVRVNGDVTYNGSGQSVQSISTVSAGVELNVLPKIYSDTIDLTLNQTVSDFIQSSGSQPTILKRSLSSRLIVQPDFVYVVGGLQTSRNSNTRTRFVGIPTGSSLTSSDSEIVLLISVKKDIFSNI